MPPSEDAAAAALLRQQRWAALASLGRDGRPLASMVAYAAEPDLSAFYLHLSRLAAHTGNRLATPEASLAISEPDP
ncbi:MAG TPA: pyridoxamine 5'-phosphate oxidase family protein, partial [Gammaproteobacteria bacterium]|nr:pyridoxamine 5'-phosphate oxidase family protein [Gammaproteobacteria bacterium]